MQFKPVDSNPDFVAIEKNLLEYWDKKGIVDKYLHKNDRSGKNYSFLDGPITANNPMGVHHAWGRTLKDLYQRYHNMKGKKQRFQNGFDCQGLWVEVEVEKELGFKSKKEIEKYGIANFVNKCKERVYKYAKIQTEQSKRLGYFMDWNNSYFTMSDENNYMIWYFIKVCHENGWLYQGKDSVPWCPRCGTAISQHEMLTEDYKLAKHEAIFFKCKIVNPKSKNSHVLVWTTTPWTIPANVALVVDPQMDYVEIEQKGERLIVAQDRLSVLLPDYKIIRHLKGSKLVGIEYEAPFDNLPRVMKHLGKYKHRVVASDPLILPVEKTEGTGIIHLASGAGSEDFALGKKENLPVIPVIDESANYLAGLGRFSGKNAKTNPEIIIDELKNNQGRKYFYKTEIYQHRYPACWRCKEELVWRVVDEWYIAMDVKPKSKATGKTLRERMIEVAKKISWMPEFGLERELDWLKNMHDWLISKKRYWGLALPIWKCVSCGDYSVIGSYEELQNKAISGWPEFAGNSPHRPWIDKVKIRCKCGQAAERIKDVGNPWLDAGIVAYSTLIDPVSKKLSYTTDKKYWRQWFPADFITESFPGQFKNWFYSLIAMSTVLENTNPFLKVLGFGTLFAEDGRPMHKSWGNSIEFDQGADKIGVDVMRLLFATQDPAHNLLFGYKLANETRRSFHLPLWNSYKYFVTYANLSDYQPKPLDWQTIENVLDKWIKVRITQVANEIDRELANYSHDQAAKLLTIFIQDLSTWYIRRSRDRASPNAEGQIDRVNFLNVLHWTLTIFCRLLAPFNPFLAEEIYRQLTKETSVHLASWPEFAPLDKGEVKLLKDMEIVRKICELGHSVRKKESIKVRQPLNKLEIRNSQSIISKELTSLVKDELNVKTVAVKLGKGELAVYLDTVITPQLKAEGEARDLVRKIQHERKVANFQPDDLVEIYAPQWPKEYEREIVKKTLAKRIIKADKFGVIKVTS